MAKKTTLEELGEMLAHVVKHMATKDDIKDMATKEDIVKVRHEIATKEDLTAFRMETAENFRDVRAEVADTRRSVEELRSRAGNTEGYSKEIDHLLERVRKIEKHLGIEPQLAA